MKNEKYEPFDWAALVPQPLIGVDEVGRGCLAGPVFAAAVILPQNFDLTGVTDSKLLSEARREKISERVLQEAHVGVGFATLEEIAKLNILHASLLAMRRAIAELKINVGHVAIDGNQRVPGLPLSLKQTTVIKGDLRVPAIAAASIVAKVRRDQVMRSLDVEFPEYRFESNKGYGSADHLAALQRYGPCAFHRRDFKGVREIWNNCRPLKTEHQFYL